MGTSYNRRMEIAAAAIYAKGITESPRIDTRTIKEIFADYEDWSKKKAKKAKKSAK